MSNEETSPNKIQEEGLLKLEDKEKNNIVNKIINLKIKNNSIKFHFNSNLF